MKEKAIEEGWQKSLKLGARPMSQGLVGLVQEKHMMSLIEVVDCTILPLIRQCMNEDCF